MLTHTVREDDEGTALQLELRGKIVRVVEMRWAVNQWVPTSKVVGLGEWNFAAQAVQVVDARMPRELVPVMNRVFGEQLRALDPTRQQGLFEKACSVCGTDRNTFPETAVRDGHGNIMETRGEKWVAPDEPVEWLCAVCDRRVCRACALAIPGSAPSSFPSLGDEYYANTYCSLACRAAAPPDMLQDDENTR